MVRGMGSMTVAGTASASGAEARALVGARGLCLAGSAGERVRLAAPWASPISCGSVCAPGARPRPISQVLRPSPRSAGSIFARGFVSPDQSQDTAVLRAAFLPQFISADTGDATHQLLLLSGTFLVVAVLLDGAWALLASRLRSLLQARARLRNRLTGGLLMGAGVGLALARRP